MRKSIGLVVSGFALLSVVVAGCASETPIDDQVMTSSEDTSVPVVEEGTISPEARANGDCCHARCSGSLGGRYGLNLGLTSGCTAWAQSFCRNAWVPSQHFADAWWGVCHF